MIKNFIISKRKPNLYFHGFNNLYIRAWLVRQLKLMEGYINMLPIAGLFLNFCAEHDRHKYELIKSKFEEAKKSSKFKEFNWKGKLKNICRIVIIKDENKDKIID
jgi:hypothetical protein